MNYRSRFHALQLPDVNVMGAC